MKKHNHHNPPYQSKRAGKVKQAHSRKARKFRQRRRQKAKDEAAQKRSQAEREKAKQRQSTPKEQPQFNALQQAFLMVDLVRKHSEASPFEGEMCQELSKTFLSTSTKSPKISGMR